MALAVIVLGVVLNSLARDTVSVSHNRARYQGMLQSSQAIENKMEADASNTTSSAPLLGTNPSDKTGGLKVDIQTRAVVADPRVEQVEVTVNYAPFRTCQMSAYRLKARRVGGGSSKGISQ